jgi:uncharacterized membrane protein YphA (DoxX/SURF4 family)
MTKLKKNIKLAFTIWHETFCMILMVLGLAALFSAAVFVIVVAIVCFIIVVLYYSFYVEFLNSNNALLLLLILCIIVIPFVVHYGYHQLVKHQWIKINSTSGEHGHDEVL